jgi:ketosteroid isomerase-like protein
MAEGNAEIVRETFERFDAGDWEIFDEVWHEDSVLTAPDGWPERGPFEGPAEIRRQFERIQGEYAESRFGDLEVLRDDGDWIVVTFTWRARGLASDIETTAEMAAAFRIVDGRAFEGHYRWAPQQALEAAGLA